MNFLAPFMLWGGLAAAIPIALHFFFRSRYRTVPWAAMKFLLASIEQTSRRLKFQELLLLCLRVALLLLLALAMARPISSVVRGAGQGTAVDTIFLFDTSMSMGASDGGMSRMQRAQDAALSILDQLPPHSTVQIITCADRAAGDSEGDKGATEEAKQGALPFALSSAPLSSSPILGLLGPRLPGNLDQARTIIKDLKPTSLATDLKDGILLAGAAVSRAKSGNKELYVFSDMQKTGWDQHPTEVKRTMEEISKEASITVVRCGQQELVNAAIIDVRPQTEVPRKGERVDFAVTVRHTSGKEPLRDLQLTLLVDGQMVEGQTKSIPLLQKGETQTITLTGKLDTSGLHTITVLMNKDDVPGDNRFDYVVRVPDYYRALIVDGGIHDPEDKDQPSLASSFYLMHEIAPVKETEYAKFHVQQTRVRAKSASAGHLDKLDVCILVNCAMPSADVEEKSYKTLSHAFLKELKQYVQAGGSLMIYTGDQVDAKDYNKILGEMYELMPLPLKGKVRDFSTDQVRDAHKKELASIGKDELPRVDRNTFRLPIYQKFRTDKVFSDFDKIEIRKAFAVVEPTRKEQAGDADSQVKQKLAIVLDGNAVDSEPTIEDIEKLREILKKGTIGDAAAKELAKAAEKTLAEIDKKRAVREKNEANVSVILRYTNNWPAVISRKIGEGEVILVTTSAEPGRDVTDKKNAGNVETQFTWNNWALNPMAGAFMKSTLAHLASGSSQEQNFVAGTTFTWNARQKTDKAFTLYHPALAPDENADKKDKKENGPKEGKRKLERLGQPVKDLNTGRAVVQANDLYFAGIYHIRAQDPNEEGKDDDLENSSDSIPLAVIADRAETENLESYKDEEFDKFLGISPSVRHLLAGTGTATTTGLDRLNREWTVWLLWLLLLLAVCEVGLAYWCGRAW